MFNIATNIFKKISSEDKQEIQKLREVFGDIEFSEFTQKGLELDEVVKFIFTNFILKAFVKEALLWESFKELIKVIFKIAAEKSDKPPEIQIWIQDVTNPSSLNIAFSIKKEEDIQKLLTTLRTKLEEDIFSKNKQEEAGKILWIAFDKNTEEWLIKVL